MKLTRLLRFIKYELKSKFYIEVEKIKLKDIFEDLEIVSDNFFKDTNEKKYLNLDEKFLKLFFYNNGNPIASFDTAILDKENIITFIEFKNINIERLENIKEEIKRKVGDTLLLYYSLNLNNSEVLKFHKPNLIIIYKWDTKLYRNWLLYRKVIDHSLGKYKPFYKKLIVCSDKELNKLKNIPFVDNWEKL